jgi:hypothetical protein
MIKKKMLSIIKTLWPNLQQQLATKLSEVDPYAEQIREMETQALEEINYDLINELANVREHQEFLLKLLTTKIALYVNVLLIKTCLT